MTAIQVRDLVKSFGTRQALAGVSLEVRQGEMVALIGASGSGKSTLIRHIAGLVSADRDGGEVLVNGRSVQSGGKIAPDIRQIRAGIGVVFQQFNLVGRLSLLTNVLVGALSRIPTWRGTLMMFSRAERAEALAALQRVGMDDFARQRASTLSGGQQQRGAIARCLTQHADIILADEPIASLDPASARRVMDTLKRINAEDGRTVVVSLHQVQYAIECCERVVALREGRVIYDGPSAALTPAFLKELYGDESDDLLIDGVAPIPDTYEPAKAMVAAAE